MSGSGSYQTRLHPDLLGEVAETFGWYEQQAPGVGRDFTRAFYATVSGAARQPMLAREMRASFRRVRLRRFPYAIYYKLEGNEVFFLLLFHSARSPKLLQQLLRSRSDDHRDQR